MSQHVAFHFRNTVFPYFSCSVSLISHMEEERELVFFLFLPCSLHIPISSLISPHYTRSNSSLYSTHSKQFSPGPRFLPPNLITADLRKRNCFGIAADAGAEQRSAAHWVVPALRGAPDPCFLFPPYFTGMLSRVT